MPDLRSDQDQHRFAQIKLRMLDSLAINAPSYLVSGAGVKTREEFRQKLDESPTILSIVECCAYEAQRMEEERARANT